MERLERYKELIQKLPFDIRLEVLLAEMLLDGFQMEDIEIASDSVFKRNYHYDIEKVEECEYPISRRRRLRFIVNRDGIYDALPQGVFHQPVDKLITHDVEKKIQELRLQQQREQAARKFFLPYEQEFYRLRIKLEMEERKFMAAVSSQTEKGIASMLWDLPDFFDEDQKDILGMLMPVMHRLAGNLSLSSFLVSKISGDKVEITKGTARSSSFSEDPVLDQKILGDDFVLGGQQASTEPCVSWDIWVSDLGQLTEYLPNGKKARIHEFLSNLLVPLDDDINMELHLNEPSEGFVLDDDPSTGIMGHITYI